MPLVSQAATYQWRDDEGVTHFTDNPDRVPARYIPRAKELPSIRGEVKGPSPASSTATPPAARSVPVTDQADRNRWQAEYGRLRNELKTIQDGLPGKKEELDKLHHTWTVRKGRTPTKGETTAFENKQAKGETTLNDNPYIGKSALATPGTAREEYYKKLDEIRKDEERIHQLEGDLEALDLKANLARVPMEWRE